MIYSIIGGGIGGLTTAVALAHYGVDAEVYESVGELKAVGAGIILAKNAMAIFERLGLSEKLKAKGKQLTKNTITNRSLHVIQEVENEGLTICIHRAILQDILVTNIDSGKLHLGKEFLKYDISNGKVTSFFKDGTKTISDFLIGADGIHSRVRQQFNSRIALRNSGQTCWRGTCNFDLPSRFQQQLTEAWGGEARFGFVSFDTDKVYWYAVHSNCVELSGDKTKSLQKLFSNFDQLVLDLIAATNPSTIHEDLIKDVHPIKYNWSNENICLLGDAAHAATPNMGQGACQAIEDGFALASALQKYPLTKKAFQQFQDARMSKVKFVVDTSWNIGQMAHWSNPFIMAIRNNLFKMIPSSIGKKQFQKIYNLSYLDDL